MARKARSPAFIAALEEATLPAPGRKKSDRTLARIRLATANCLERTGYIGLKASDISEEAGLSEGSFYVYFEDKQQAAISVLSDFIRMGVTAPGDRGRAPNAFEAIRNTNRVWIKSAMDHPGLMKSVVQLVDSEPAFADTYSFHNRQWHEMVAGSVLRRYPPDQKDSKVSILFAVVALNAMMDEVARGIFATGAYAHLLDLVEKDKNGEHLADALSVIWFRVLYPGVALPLNKRKQPYLMAELDGALAELGIDKSSAVATKRRVRR